MTAITGADFHRASLFVSPGEWLQSIELPRAVEFHDECVELDDPQPSAAEYASERV